MLVDLEALNDWVGQIEVDLAASRVWQRLKALEYVNRKLGWPLTFHPAEECLPGVALGFRFNTATAAWTR